MSAGEGARTDKADTVRVMTWNIHGTFGRNPRFDLARVAELIRGWDPDIVALQEVDSRRALADGANPFDYLTGAVGIYGIGAKTLTSADGDYGQMLISRWPVERHTVHDISFGAREPRRAIAACIATPFGPLTAIATHLGLSMRERRSQAGLLSKLIAGDGPTVVIGDFNDWMWAGAVRGALARQLPRFTRLATFPSRFPMLQLDRIYCRPQAAMTASFIDPAARSLSDHLPLIADLKLGPRLAQADKNAA